MELICLGLKKKAYSFRPNIKNEDLTVEKVDNIPKNFENFNVVKTLNYHVKIPIVSPNLLNHLKEIVCLISK